MKIQSARFLALIFTGILILCLPACSPAPYHFIVVEKIEVDNNQIYVRASQECNFCEDIEGLVYYASHDNGQTWEEIISPTEDVLKKLEDQQGKQSALCLAPDSQICYQITGREQVEVSNDGGIAWQIDWQTPAGRKLYMERRVLGLNPDTIPFDIQTIESDTGYFVIVAMGNQGVLVKSPDGIWSRHAVGLAVPTPYQAADLSEAIDVLYTELYGALAITVVFLLLLTICVWIIIFVNSERVLRKKILLSGVPILLSLVIIFSFYSTAFLSRNIEWLQGPRSFFLSNFSFVINIAMFYVYISPFLGYIVTWLTVILFSPNRHLSLATFMLGMVFSVLLYIFILIPYLLWALGTISVYGTASLISPIAGVVVALIALITEFRIAVLAVKPIGK